MKQNREDIRYSALKYRPFIAYAIIASTMLSCDKHSTLLLNNPFLNNLYYHSSSLRKSTTVGLPLLFAAPVLIPV